MPKHNLLRVREASEQSGIPYDTLVRLVRKGVIPSFKMGYRTVYVDPLDVEAYLADIYSASTKARR